MKTLTRTVVLLNVYPSYTTRRDPEEGFESTRLEGYYVQASSVRGDRWLHYHVFPDFAGAAGLRDRIDRAGGADLVARLTDGSLVWVQGDPIYGSPLYQELGMEEAWAERERLEEAW